MNKDVYKRAVDDIKPSAQLINDTVVKMKRAKIAPQAGWRRYVIARSIAVLVLSIMIIPLLFQVLMVEPLPRNKSQPLVQSESAQDPAIPKAKPLSPILDNYVPFNATQFHSVKVPAPRAPFYYEELKQESQAVLLCTISDIGVYRNKAEQYNPRASFGTYIYTVKIDKILSGSIAEQTNDLIPIAELAWAKPKQEGITAEISEWSFAPYTGRANEAKILEKDKQYVMFLGQKDDTDVYQLSWDGFGVFPIGYIEHVSKYYSLSELQRQYEYVEKVSRAPNENNLLFKLSSLRIKEEFLLNQD